MIFCNWILAGIHWCFKFDWVCRWLHTCLSLQQPGIGFYLLTWIIGFVALDCLILFFFLVMVSLYQLAWCMSSYTHFVIECLISKSSILTYCRVGSKGVHGLGWIGMGEKKVPRNSVFLENLIDCFIPIDMKKKKKKRCCPNGTNPTYFNRFGKGSLGQEKKSKTKLNHICDR